MTTTKIKPDNSHYSKDMDELRLSMLDVLSALDRIVEKIYNSDEYQFIRLWAMGKVENTGQENLSIMKEMMLNLSNDLAKTAKEIRERG